MYVEVEYHVQTKDHFLYRLPSVHPLKGVFYHSVGDRFLVMAKQIDRVGMRYCRLTVVSLNRKEKNRKGRGYVYYWNCKCDCGKSIVVSGKSLSCGHRESCGCLHAEHTAIAKRGVNIKYGIIPRFNTEKEALGYLYEITPEGRIFSRCDGREMASSNGPKGYKHIRLKNPQFSKNEDGRKTYKVHRLVAMFHLPDYAETLQVNHKNGDKGDNRVENLEMVTNQENVRHAWKYLDKEGRRRKQLGERNLVVFRHKWVRVRQLLDGEIIAEFDSIAEAARKICGRADSIFNSCKYGRKYLGFNWERVA